MLSDLSQYNLQDKKIEFEEELEWLGVPAPVIEGIYYSDEELIWEFELSDGYDDVSFISGVSPVMAALHWAIDNESLGSLDERLLKTNGLTFNEYYILHERTASGEFAV